MSWCLHAFIHMTITLAPYRSGDKQGANSIMQGGAHGFEIQINIKLLYYVVYVSAARIIIINYFTNCKTVLAFVLTCVSPGCNSMLLGATRKVDVLVSSLKLKVNSASIHPLLFMARVSMFSGNRPSR